MAGFAEPAGIDVWRRAVRVVLAVAIVGIVALAVRERITGPPPGTPVTMTVYGISVLQGPFDHDLLPTFARVHEERTGERVEFITAFAGSGLITEEIVRRFPAEIAILSSEIDAFRLVRAGVLPGPTWRSLPDRGVPFRTPLVLAVRPGNPEAILGWSDLARDDVDVVVADPVSSGCGELAVLAVWGDAVRAGREPAGAADAVARVWRRVIAAPPTARAARMLFEAGVGDVVVLYESEARVANGAEIVRPPETLLAEPVLCVVPRNVGEDARERIDAFVTWMWTDDARSRIAAHGFRTDPGPAAGEYRLADLGDAATLQRDVLDRVWLRPGAVAPTP